MVKRRREERRVLLALGVVCALGSAAGAASAADTLAAIKQRDGIAIAKDQISISGVSAGGWQAVQYHVAHSKQIMGVGVVAGGPYHCSGAYSYVCNAWSSPTAWYWATFGEHDVCQAVHVCSRLAPPYEGPPVLQDSIAAAQAEATRGAIDPLEGLSRARVWVFTGGPETDRVHDGLMPHDVVQQVAGFYQFFSKEPNKANVKFVDSPDAAHAMPVKAEATARSSPCDYFGEPYINNCNYAAAEELLQFIYPGRPETSNSRASEDRLQSFTQPIDAADPNLSMNEIGHIYVPHACLQGQSCALHVALHGCGQDEQSLDEASLPGGAGKFRDLPAQERPYFYRAAGYNDWAERHGVVVLYPQVKARAGTLSQQGCWDWFAYSGGDYYVQKGLQITAINKMIQCLTGENACR